MTKQVLILNMTRIGDLVQTIPLLERLHQEWPGVAIDMVADRRCLGMAGLRHVYPDDLHVRA